MAPDKNSVPREEEEEEQRGEEPSPANRVICQQPHHHSLGPRERVPAVLTISAVCFQIYTHSSSFFAKVDMLRRPSDGE